MLRIRGKQGDNGTAIHGQKGIGMRQRIARKVDGKSVGICASNRFAIGFRPVFMGIGESLPSDVRLDQRAKRMVIDLLTYPRQIPGLIMAPNLP